MHIFPTEALHYGRKKFQIIKYFCPKLKLLTKIEKTKKMREPNNKNGIRKYYHHI